MSNIRNGWIVSIELVTPQMAEIYLEKNSINRRVRPGVVRRYATTMANDKWMLTPESVCFDTSEVLLNGQHRLKAIVESGCSVAMMIVRGVDRACFPAFDRGANRSYSDALGIDKRLAEISRLAAVIAGGKWSKNLADFQVGYMADVLGDAHEELMAACSTTARIVSSAPFRLAACVRILSGDDPDYVKSAYRGMCLGRVHELPTICQSVLGAVAIGRIVGGGGAVQFDLLVRAWKMFDKTMEHKSKIQINDQSVQIAEIVDVLAPLREESMRNVG